MVMMMVDVSHLCTQYQNKKSKVREQIVDSTKVDFFLISCLQCPKSQVLILSLATDDN